MTDKPMTVGDWEDEIQSLINKIQQLEINSNMDDTFEAGRVSGCQYARSRLNTILAISKGEIKIDKSHNDHYGK